MSKTGWGPTCRGLGFCKFLFSIPSERVAVFRGKDGDCHTYLIFHCRDKMSLFPPVHGGWVGTPAPKVVTFGGRAVLAQQIQLFSVGGKNLFDRNMCH